jgi:hypothetical protein
MTTRIYGNTYPVRISLARLGGQYRGGVWVVPTNRLEDAARLLFPVSAERDMAEAIRLMTTPAAAAAKPARRAPRTCKTCGCRINYGVYCGKCEFAR